MVMLGEIVYLRMRVIVMSILFVGAGHIDGVSLNPAALFRKAGIPLMQGGQDEVCIGILPIVGPITTSFQYVKDIYALAQNPEVKAVLVHMDSGGGAPTSSQMIAQELSRLKKSKPVVVFVENACASGAYWIASVADIIIAQTTSVIGSIGVAKQIRKPKNMFYITAGKFKRPTFGDTALAPEYEEYEQSITNETYDIFCKEIADQRGLSLDAIKAQEARVFMGQKALELGLVDQVGDLEDAFSAVRLVLAKKRGIPCGTLKFVYADGGEFITIKHEN